MVRYLGLPAMSFTSLIAYQPMPAAKVRGVGVRAQGVVNATQILDPRGS